MFYKNLMIAILVMNFNNFVHATTNTGNDLTPSVVSDNQQLAVIYHNEAWDRIQAIIDHVHKIRLEANNQTVISISLAEWNHMRNLIAELDQPQPHKINHDTYHAWQCISGTNPFLNFSDEGSR